MPTPSALVDAPLAAGSITATTPAKPASRPTIRRGRGTARAISAATTAANSGTPPLSMPATEESMWRWASGKRTNGAAIQTVPSSATRAQSARATRRRAAGKASSATNPNVRRSSATSAGGKASSPSAISRNDEPHSTAQVARSAQSRVSNPLSSIGKSLPFNGLIGKRR